MWRRRVLIGWAAITVSWGSLAAVCGGQAAATAGPRIRAADVAALRRQVGQEVTVAGRVSRTGESQSGMQFLNFADSEFTVVCHKADAARFPGGTPADTYRGRDVEITGTVELYRGKVQIRLRTPAQIREVGHRPPGRPQADPDGGPPPAEFALRQIGDDVWLSPAGLRYQGRDPAGLSRVDHICRHVTDIPSREGPHGVFDGGRERAFAVIDEAWKLARSRRIRPAVEGERSSCTVEMGRRIGFLGGQTGAARKHPPLSRVFIVFETGTTNIITAFPK